MKFKKFVPFNYNKSILFRKILNKNTKRNWHYASSGRASIYHIIRALKIKSIAVPVYICKTILEPLNKLKCNIYYYDIDLEDLNPSFKSFKKLYKEVYEVDAVLVSSMYGNPANLLEFEKFCRDNNIVLIDDAAQAIGAKLNNKYVGTFGNAGFFSISPGKPIYGHLGAFLFIDKIDYKIDYKNNFIYHRLKYLYFLYRKNIYKFESRFIEKILLALIIVYEKVFDTYNGKLNNFEEEIVFNLIYDGICEITLDIKNQLCKILSQKLHNHKKIRVLQSVRGKPNCTKIVLIIKDIETAKMFKQYLIDNNIFFINGYELLYKNKKFKNSYLLDGLIFELPLENDMKKLGYLINILNDFK